MRKSPYAALKAFVWVYLFISALVLCIFKLKLFDLGNRELLIFINTNLLLTSALAVACVTQVLRRAVLDDVGREYWKILLVALGLLFATELAGAIEEWLDMSSGESMAISSMIGLPARLALIYLAMRVIVSSQISTWIGWLQALLPWIFIISFSLFALYFVILPMQREHGSIDEVIGPIFMVFAGLVVVIFMTAALAGRRIGDPDKTLAYFWPLAGMVGYMVTDVMYYCHMAMHIETFVLWEFGFFAGFLFSAYGALLMLDDKRAAI